jgi:iron(III) transport system ATP-binding protein
MQLNIKRLRKAYGRHLAVKDIDLSVAEGQFAVVLGPSGCGKTTTLRCLAGLEKPDAGEISIGSQTVFSDGVYVPPEKRNIGMIFQSYALWPHMTVYGNVAFPFEARRRTGPEIASRIRDVLAMVGLSALENRSASLLSGGQMQRVALARALACEPAALLFDEPLSNLDLKLRQHLRIELRQLQQASGATTVFVTHDQAEAAALADRVIVMNEGRIEQDDAPEMLFSKPANRFVADFIGVGNLLAFTPTDSLGDRRWRGRIGQTLELTGCTYDHADLSKETWIWFRPEAVELNDSRHPADDAVRFDGAIVSRSFTGTDYLYGVRVPGMDEIKVTMRNKLKIPLGDGVSLCVSSSDAYLVPAR